MILLFKAARILAPGIFLVRRNWKGHVALILILPLVVTSGPTRGGVNRAGDFHCLYTMGS